MDPVTLSISPNPRLVRLARLVAGGYGSLVGLDVDALDDLRIAIDEACVWLMERSDGSPISLLITFDGSCIEVRGTTRGAQGTTSMEPLDRSALAHQILAVAVQDHGTEGADGVITFWFRAHPVAS